MITTTTPTTAAPSTTSQPNEARRTLLSGILDSHHSAGEFVGARIAVLDRDGTITEVADGTATTDASSAPVDVDAGIDRYLPTLAGADRITPRQLLQHTSGLGDYGDQPHC